MRFPSLALVASEAAAVCRRFPVVVAYAAVAATAAIVATESEGNRELFERSLRILFAASLGLPLAVAITVAGEKNGWLMPVRWILHLVGGAVLVAFYLAWPHWSEAVGLRRYFQLSIGFHLLAAFLPHAGTGELNGFWQYNKTIFLRFLLAALYAGILYAGLSIAILALDKLFGLNVPGERYVEMWILIGILFTTFFFLGGTPDDFKRLNTVTGYPRGLRIFSQFILLPLVMVYLVILTVYMGKIVVTQVWPSGWIGYLVSSVAVAGILVLLLVHPIREREENNWVRTYSRLFFIVLLPSVAMLLMAVFKRIDQYGLTENRYFMVVLAFWLAAICLYFIASRSKNIKVIPTTLCALALVTFLGPWGPYQWSERSQIGRLERLFTDHGILADGKAQAAPAEVPFEARREMSAILNYLVETHGGDPIAGWFENGLAWMDTVGSDSSRRDRVRGALAAGRIMEDLGMEYVGRWEREEQRRFNYWTAAPYQALDISDYTFSFAVANSKDATIVLDGETYQLLYEMESASLRFMQEEELLIRIPVGDLIERAYTTGPPGTSGDTEPMVIRVENESLAVMLQVRNMNGLETEDGPRLNQFSGVFFLRFAPPGTATDPR